MTDGAPVDAATTDGDGGDEDPTAKKSPWQTATVIGIRPETERAKTFRFALPQPTDRLAGQHYVIRLMAPDGYTAQRSYSVANPPDGSNEIDLTIERLEGGEVSMFMHDDVAVGDELEVRGPSGAGSYGRGRRRPCSWAVGREWRPSWPCSAWRERSGGQICYVSSSPCARRPTSTMRTSCRGRRAPSSTPGRLLPVPRGGLAV